MRKMLNLQDYAIISMSSDESLLVALTKFVTIYQFPSLDKVQTFKDIKNPQYACFSIDNKLLAVKSTSGQIMVFDLEKKEVGYVINQTKDAGDGSNMVFTSDKKFILDGDWNGNLRAFDLENKEMRILKKSNNSMMMKINTKNNHDYFQVHTYYCGGRSILDFRYSLIEEWKYQNGQFIFVNETTKIKNHSAGFSYDGYRDVFFSIVYKKLKDQHHYSIKKYDKTLQKAIDMKEIETDKKINLKTHIPTNSNIMVVSSDDWINIFSLPKLHLIKTINITSNLYNFYISSSSNYICISESINSMKEAGCISIETLF